MTVSCARPCLTACCAAFLAPEDGLCPSHCSLPAHRERQNTGDTRTYLPRTHGNRQRVCLSHLCCWIGVWRRKEGRKSHFYCSMSLCTPAARSRGWGTALCPPPTASVPGQLPHCWAQATPETLLPAPGWGRGQGRGLWDTSKAGCSLLTAAVPLPSSLPWLRACAPARAQCPIPLSPSPRPDHR